MNTDIEVIFHFNDNRTPCEGFRPSHLIDSVNLTTGVHHYYETSNDEIKGTIEFIDPEYFSNCLKEGRIIEMYDGSNKIGFVEVLRVLNPILEE